MFWLMDGFLDLDLGRMGTRIWEIASSVECKSGLGIRFKMQDARFKRKKATNLKNEYPKPEPKSRLYINDQEGSNRLPPSIHEANTYLPTCYHSPHPWPTAVGSFNQSKPIARIRSRPRADAIRSKARNEAEPANGQGARQRQSDKRGMRSRQSNRRG